MQTYQNTPHGLAIPSEGNDSDMIATDMTRPSPWWSVRSKSVLVVLGTIAVALVVALANRSAAPATAAASFATTPVLGSSITSSTSATACTFDECFASSCNSKVAPYTCLFHNGGPHGGCSDIPWTTESCTQQCDLTNCDSLVIPTDTKSCADEPCDAAWCAMGRICGPDVPYQCTGGASTFGCSSDKFQWTFRTASTSCSSCCDSSSC